jgi:hypothetical protein
MTKKLFWKKSIPFLAFYGEYFDLSKGGILAFPDKRNNNLSLLYTEALVGVLAAADSYMILSRTGVLLRLHLGVGPACLQP